MSEKKRKQIVYAVFIVAVIWGLYNQPWKRPTRHTASDDVPVAAATATPVALRPTAQTTGTSAGAPVVKDWRLDPFRTFEAKDRSAYVAPVVDDHAMPVLKGTMVVGGRRLCVLDDRVCRTGQQIGDWTVVKIGQGDVVMQGPAGQRVELVAADRETGE